MSIFKSKLKANLDPTLQQASTGLKNGYKELMNRKTDENSINEPVSRFRQLVRQMNILLNVIQNLHGTDSSREPELPPALYDALISQYQEVKQQLQGLRSAYENAGETGYSKYSDINQAVGSFLNASPETWIDQDLQELTAKKQAAASEAQIQTFLNEVTGVVTADQEPESPQEYLPPDRMIPNAILCSGNSTDLAAFYLANQTNLRQDEQEYIKYRLQSLRYIELLAEKCAHQDKKLTKITESGQGENWDLCMPDLQLYEHQSSGNGCWSCSYQLLLQSRGVLLDQKLIRSFRPGLDSSQTMKFSPEAVAPMLADQIGSPFEMADLTMKLLPNTAMFNTTLSVLTENMNSGNSDRGEMAQKLNQVVEKALRQHHSPVSISNSAHFITIVGRRGSDGKWLVRDSMNFDPNKMNYYSTEDLLDWAKRGAISKGNIFTSLQLTWLKDLQPQIDGTCQDLASDGFGRVNFKDFSSQLVTGALHSEGEADAEAETSIESHLFLNRPGDPFKLQITESLSVPKTLNPEVHLVPQENFVKGPEFDKWKQGPELLPNDFTVLASIPFMNQTLFNSKLIEDANYKKSVEGLTGVTLPEWTNLGERPAPFTEPEPAAPPTHGPIGRFINWLIKLITGVDRYAEEQNHYQQSVTDWNERRNQSVIEQGNYNAAKENNEVIESAYRFMSESYRKEQETVLPAYQEVRTVFRQNTELQLRIALHDMDQDKLATACAGILADFYLVSNPEARNDGANSYQNRLNNLAAELTVTIDDLFTRNITLHNNVITYLFTTNDSKILEQGLIRFLDGPVKKQLQKAAQPSSQETVAVMQPNDKQIILGQK